jgi:ABC-2 type transport system permease protein
MIPQGLEGKLRPYSGEAQAQTALRAGEITAYYVVPGDYVQRGDLTYIRPEFSGFAPEGQSWSMRWTLLVNLLNGDTELAHQIWDPPQLEVTALAPATDTEFGSGARFWLPYATTMVLYLVLIMSSSLLRNSMGGERKNRVLEVLMLSVKPSEVFTGKLFGLAVVGLLQTLIWTGTGYALLRLGGRRLSLPAGILPPLSIIAWALLFFLLGYLVYAGLLAGLGALTGPNQAGSSTADFVIIWPVVIPMFFMVFLIESPNGAIATVLSLFPFTAPIAMMTRLVAGGVPWWQPFLAAALLALTALVVIRAVARVFRAQMLLSGQPATTKHYFAALLGRA